MNISSVTGKNWIYKKFDSSDVKNISEKYSLSEISSKLLSIRKGEIGNLDLFLDPKIKNLLPNPMNLKDMNEAIERTSIKRNPFHPFSCFDTATICGVAFGQTVLTRAVITAGFEWDEKQAHSASYDAEKTADVFCEAVNRFNVVYKKLNN